MKQLEEEERARWLAEAPTQEGHMALIHQALICATRSRLPSSARQPAPSRRIRSTRTTNWRVASVDLRAQIQRGRALRIEQAERARRRSLALMEKEMHRRLALLNLASPPPSSTREALVNEICGNGRPSHHPPSPSLFHFHFSD